MSDEPDDVADAAIFAMTNATDHAPPREPITIERLLETQREILGRQPRSLTDATWRAIRSPFVPLSPSILRMADEIEEGARERWRALASGPIYPLHRPRSLVSLDGLAACQPAIRLRSPTCGARSRDLRGALEKLPDVESYRCQDPAVADMFEGHLRDIIGCDVAFVRRASSMHSKVARSRFGRPRVGAVFAYCADVLPTCVKPRLPGAPLPLSS